MSESWSPVLDQSGLHQRAQFFAKIREFFCTRNVVEVDTPVMSRFASCDPNIHSLKSEIGKQSVFLHTSPEFFMKRLLAAGSGDIFSIARVFRDDESGRLHNPEFVLLEWYRTNFNLAAMARETVELISLLLGLPDSSCFKQRSYKDAFGEYADIDPFTATNQQLKQIAASAGLDSSEMARDDLLDFIAGSKVFPKLGRQGLEVLTGYPATQAALAEISTSDPAVAERFEVFLDGIELANGFQELRDAEEQKARFEADNEKRQRIGEPEMPVDIMLLEALDHGLPECSGVALGLDRLFMIARGGSSISTAMSFPFDKC